MTRLAGGRTADRGSEFLHRFSPRKPPSFRRGHIVAFAEMLAFRRREIGAVNGPSALHGFLRRLVSPRRHSSHPWPMLVPVLPSAVNCYPQRIPRLLTWDCLLSVA